MSRPAPFGPGDLLVAVPHLADPSFRRTVVLVLHHDEDGAVGVVLNRPLELEVAAVLPAWQDVMTQPPRLFQGGPVGLDGALGLATLPAGAEPPPAVSRVAAAFGVVDLDGDPEGTARGVLGLRVFAGHAGWSAGQLDAEVAAGDWYVVPALPSDVVTGRPEQLWRTVLRRQGGALAVAAAWPDDPSLN